MNIAFFVAVFVLHLAAVARHNPRGFSFRRASTFVGTSTLRGTPARLWCAAHGGELRAKNIFCFTQEFTEKSPNNPPTRRRGRP